MPRKRSPKTQNKSILSLLLLILVIGFLFVGNRLAEEKLSEPVEVAKEVSRTSSAYQDFLEDHQLASESSSVSQTDEAAKNSPASQSTRQAESHSQVSETNQSEKQPLKESESVIENDVSLAQLHNRPPKVPEGQAYVEVNGNVPVFDNEALTEVEASWERYSPLDKLGRVGAANALLAVDLMPAETVERESLTSITPTGWQQKRYDSDLVSGGWLYNRSHLIGFQLTGQQDNLLNLMTGTRYFNVTGMLPFENYVAAYIEDTENHVRYRITPLFMGDELLARGIFMEAYSIEDDGELQFHVYISNTQPGIQIDYTDGENRKL